MLRYDRVVIPLHAYYKEKFLRIFCISDIHVEYEINRRWLNNLSQHDYKNDLLILAGDITNNLMLLEKILGEIGRVRPGDVGNRGRDVLQLSLFPV